MQKRARRPQKLSMIGAMAENRVIGNKNQLPWDMPADLAHFKGITLGKPIIMGLNTFRSIGRPLPKRLNIVLSHTNDLIDGVEVVGSVDQALAAAGDSDEAFVIGGQRVFETFLPLVDRIYLTVIHAMPEGDTFFPELDGSQWTISSRDDHTIDERNPFDYTFLIYDRAN